MRGRTAVAERFPLPAGLLKRMRVGPDVVEGPTAPESSPYNAVVGHLIGTLAGMAAIVLFGLLLAPQRARGRGHSRPGRRGGRLGGPGRLGAALAASQRPPAGATTLLASLGLLDELNQLAWVMGGVLLLIAASWALNRLAGLPVGLRQD